MKKTRAENTAALAAVAAALGLSAALTEAVTTAMRTGRQENKYVPHQGTREIERRKRKAAR